VVHPQRALIVDQPGLILISLVWASSKPFVHSMQLVRGTTGRLSAGGVSLCGASMPFKYTYRWFHARVRRLSTLIQLNPVDHTRIYNGGVVFNGSWYLHLLVGRGPLDSHQQMLAYSSVFRRLVLSRRLFRSYCDDHKHTAGPCHSVRSSVVIQTRSK
jgi:hypothetical protein